MQSLYETLRFMILVAGLLAVSAGSCLADDFQVTGATLKADEPRLTGPCPLQVIFNGSITTNGPGVVTYRFTRSDGATGPTLTLRFPTAGTRRVTTDWTLGGDSLAHYDGWQAIKILSPNELESRHDTGSFSIDCGATAPAPGPSIVAYTAATRPLGSPSRRFRVGETVLLRVENNATNPIYSLYARPDVQEIIRGEGIVVQFFDSGTWRDSVSRSFIDYAAYQFLGLPPRMNITRHWTERFARPGTYRFAFTYFSTPDDTIYDRPPSRALGTTIYSETFEVVP